MKVYSKWLLATLISLIAMLFIAWTGGVSSDNSAGLSLFQSPINPTPPTLTLCLSRRPCHRPHLRPHPLLRPALP